MTTRPADAPHPHEPGPHEGRSTERDRALDELAALSLPLMWSLRQEAMRLYEPLGLRPTRVLVLELVDRGIDRPGVLADALDTVPAGVTAILNELDERGLLERRVDAADRRRTRLRVTVAGRSLLGDARARWSDATRLRLERLATDDVLAMLRTVRALVTPTHDAGAAAVHELAAADLAAAGDAARSAGEGDAMDAGGTGP